ncbi:hypothetical protein OPQ81_006466 [Rhizoctonia solani]|nr:hypothetical protein OPQ81_006466 [Rhizoctonia solani]
MLIGSFSILGSPPEASIATGFLARYHRCDDPLQLFVFRSHGASCILQAGSPPPTSVSSPGPPIFDVDLGPDKAYLGKVSGRYIGVTPHIFS